MKVAQLLEAKKQVFKKPPLPPAKEEDIQAVREAVSFLFAVQKRLEKLDELYRDDDYYGGIGIYGHNISFRWFGGGGEHIPPADKAAIRKIVKEERAKRKHLQRFLADKIVFEPGEGSIDIPWLSGYWSPEFQAAREAAGLKHVDYSDMVKEIHSLAEAREEDEHGSLFLTLLRKLLDERKTVYLQAHGKTELQGRRNELKAVRTRRTGRIQEIKTGHLVYDFVRDRDPNDRTISNSFFILEQPVDEYYTIQKNKDGTFTVVDA
jgi:hypothetical protein